MVTQKFLKTVYPALDDKVLETVLAEFKEDGVKFTAQFLTNLLEHDSKDYDKFMKHYARANVPEIVREALSAYAVMFETLKRQSR